MTAGDRPLNEQPEEIKEPYTIEYDAVTDTGVAIKGWESYRVHRTVSMDGLGTIYPLNGSLVWPEEIKSSGPLNGSPVHKQENKSGRD